MSNSIEQIIQQIESEIQINEQGQGSATIRATSRLAGVDDRSLRKAFESAEQKPSKLATSLMGQGFSAADLALFSESGVPDTAIAIILEYYGHEAGRYCTKEARQVLKAFGAIGLRAWMQRIKGWQEPKQQEPTTPAQMFFEIAKQLVEQERRQLELAQQQQELSQRLAVFEQIQAKAHNELIALPPASSVPEESIDMKVRRIVGNYSSVTGLAQRDVWRNLYQQFRLRYRRIVKKQDRETTLQAFVRMGLVGNLYDLAIELLANKSVVPFRRIS